MSHLSTDDLVEALDPTATARVSAHLAACSRCRRALDQLAVTRDTVKNVEAPEPSPLFWSHFASRVRRAIESEPPARTVRWLPHPLHAGWAWTLAATAVVVLAISGAVLLGPGSAPVREAAPSAGIASQPEADPAMVDAEAPWAFIGDAGAGVDWDVISAAVLDPAPGSAERAVLELTDVERRELARLLRLELAGSSS